MRYFNITGTCYPYKHYMVDISKRLEDIKVMVDRGDYITINRGRQYGKTTTLFHLAQRLCNDYVVFSISFEAFNEENFGNINKLAYSFLEQMQNIIDFADIKNLNDVVKNAIDEILAENASNEEISTNDFNKFISTICAKSSKPIVIFIDEVDNASNYDSFLNLLRLLRDKYLKREMFPTFQSVILAGVYDIKNLKLKVRPDSDHQYNSPWNVAVAFKENMAFNKDQITQMISDYEADHNTGMNIDEIATLIEDYTSGYPFLVSKLCKQIDEDKLGWDKAGVIQAVRMLLSEKNTFFDDINKKLDDFPKMKTLLKGILYNGYEESFNIYYKHIEIAAMFNYIKDENGKVRISNRIIETWLYNLFMTEEAIDNSLYREGQIDRSDFVEEGKLKMDKIMERFAFHFNDIYGDRGDRFCEDEGRRYFMLYIRPIINGTGNYYIEAQTRDMSRTDMIIDYLGTQYIIEMKIWRGNSYNERGEKQMLEYLDYYHISKGYMLSFCFNKNKTSGVKTITIGDKAIVEAVV
ncbi:MAG: ATP-binding protein [Bacteroidales bacterium]|nr:ATP-binding protein [Bacteroidales bacterium]